MLWRHHVQVVGFWLVVVREMSCGWYSPILLTWVSLNFWSFQCRQPHVFNSCLHWKLQKIQNSNSHSERGNSSRSTTGHRPHNNQSENNRHAGDDIATLKDNVVNRELPVDSEQQHRNQSSEDAGHSRRRNIREKKKS